MAAITVDLRRVAALKRRIGPSFLSFEFARAGGPGGQNVNKVNTQVTLWFDLDTCPSLSKSEKDVLRRKLKGRMSKDGWLRVVSRRHRTQRANRKATIERFYVLLVEALMTRKERVATRVPSGQKRKRLEEKRKTSDKKRNRRVVRNEVE